MREFLQHPESRVAEGPRHLVDNVRRIMRCAERDTSTGGYDASTRRSETHVAPISNVRPTRTRSSPTSPTTRRSTRSRARGLRHRALLPDGHARLRLRGARVSGVHQAARARSCRAPSCRTAPRCRARSYQLDPVQAAFNIGAMIRWLDFNDTWLAAEWGHPSDNLGGILAVADWLSRNAVAAGKTPLTMRDVLTAMIKAHEIQGVHRAGEQLQPRRPRPRGAGARSPPPRWSRSMLGLARATRSSTRVSQAWVDGQSAAHLPPRAEHRLAQELGGGRRDVARGAPGADRARPARWAIRRC